MTVLTERKVIHFSRGVPPLEAIPVRELTEYATEVIKEAQDVVFQYAPLGQYQGDPALRKQIAAFLGFDADRIFIGNGSLQVLDLLSAHLLHGERGKIFVEAPTYDRAVQIFERHGGEVIGLPMESDGIDMEALEKLLLGGSPVFLYTIPDFQNPSGITMSEAKRRALVELAARFRFTIVEDIPYRELRYRGASPPLIARIGQETAGQVRVITIGSLTKILSPGLRIGYAISDQETSRALASLAEGTYLSPSPLCQAIAARCLSMGVVDVNIARAREILRPRHDGAVAATKKLLGPGLLSVPDGGYFLSIHLPVRGDEASFIQAAKKEGIILSRGSGFYPPGSVLPPGKLFVRLPFHALEPQDFAMGLEQLVNIAQNLG